MTSIQHEPGQRTPGAVPLGELRALAPLHARAQGIAPARCRTLLARIGTADGEAPDSWAAVWSRAGDGLAARGHHLDAARHYALARFPYAEGPLRERAQRLCVRSFDHWRSARSGIGRLEVELPGSGRFACWTAGLSATAPRPLIVVMGGIVSVKEQWAPLLARASALGTALAVTEMPGVGENTLPYGGDGPGGPTGADGSGGSAMLPALLDALAGRADVRRTYVLALSFGGHLALRAALTDRRIRGVGTVGAPVRHFFLDRERQRHVPAATRLTLARLTGRPTSGVFDALRGTALDEDELAALSGLPVTYVAALRDGIVPLADAAELLRDPAAPRELLLLDDEHGAPAHLARVRLTLLRSALRGLRLHPVRRTLLGAADGVRRAAGAGGRVGV